MQFHCRQQSTEVGQEWTILLLDDRLEPYCCLAAPKDTVTDWCCAWEELLATPARACDAQRLVNDAAEIFGCQFASESDYQTALRVICGLGRCLSEQDGMQAEVAKIRKALESNIVFRATEDKVIIQLMRCGLQESPQHNASRPKCSHQVVRFEASFLPSSDRETPVHTQPEAWEVVIREMQAADLREQSQGLGAVQRSSDLRSEINIQPSFIESVTRYYAMLHSVTCLQYDGTLMLCFMEFSRALAGLIEQDDHYRRFRRHELQEIRSTIARRETDLAVARAALVRVLDGPPPPSGTHSNVTRLMCNMKGDNKERRFAANATTANLAERGPFTREPDSDERLAILAATISEYYLERFDLPHAVDTWRQTGRKDRSLAALLGLLDHPWRAAGLHAAAFAVLTFLAVMQHHVPVLKPTDVWASLVPGGLILVPLLPNSLIVLMVGLWILGAAQHAVLLQASAFLIILGFWIEVVGAVMLVFRGLLGRQFHYTQLLLPRMAGAVAVGLSALTLNDLPWKIALWSPWPSWLLLMGGVYSLSYLYILLDVYHTVRLRPPPRTSSDRPGGSRADSILAYASQVAWRIFGIGVLESFLATVVVSGLLLPIVGGWGRPDGPWWSASFLGALEFQFGPLSFVFAPQLVLAWTGMALFIGAFLQLLWQDRHITSPVRD
jgi:hypothetical protein